MRQLSRIMNRSKDFFFHPLLYPHFRKRLYGKVICLLYHRVDEDNSNTFLTRGGSPAITPADFEKELRFLKKQGGVFLARPRQSAYFWSFKEPLNLAGTAVNVEREGSCPAGLRLDHVYSALPCVFVVEDAEAHLINYRK